jgi:hypothetical protein
MSEEQAMDRCASSWFSSIPSPWIECSAEIRPAVLQSLSSSSIFIDSIVSLSTRLPYPYSQEEKKGNHQACHQLKARRHHYLVALSSPELPSKPAEIGEEERESRRERGRWTYYPTPSRSSSLTPIWPPCQNPRWLLLPLLAGTGASTGARGRKRCDGGRRRAWEEAADKSSAPALERRIAFLDRKDIRI